MISRGGAPDGGFAPTRSRIDQGRDPMTLATATAAFALSGSLLVAAPATKVSLKDPGPTPKIGVQWDYSITAEAGGKPAAATLSEQIVDPIGGAHPVEFGKSTKDITNWPFRGTFRDFIIWPASSRGIPLQLRAVVRVGAKKTVLTVTVTPRK
jgi:hypothetical protein